MGKPAARFEVRGSRPQSLRLCARVHPRRDWQLSQQSTLWFAVGQDGAEDLWYGGECLLWDRRLLMQFGNDKFSLS
jgi:hypothetical protein